MILMLALAGAASVGSATALAGDADAEKKEALERKERYEKWMREFAEGMRIRIRSPDVTENEAKVVARPIFRYSGDNIHADDATLWVWTYKARPVAFQKIEVNNIPHILNGRSWTISFGSTCESLFDVTWPGGREYSTRVPGAVFRPVPDAAPPADDARTRSRQLKSLKDRFTGYTLGPAPKGPADYELKPLPTPVFEYDDPASKLPLGAVFNMVNHDRGELNPILLLLLEARLDPDGNLRWEYASRRLGMWSATLKLDGEKVSFVPVVRMSDQIQDDWTFYFMPRDFD
jgi:hypothetical protein